jgi:hypothetical protein
VNAYLAGGWQPSPSALGHGRTQDGHTKKLKNSTIPAKCFRDGKAYIHSFLPLLALSRGEKGRKERRGGKAHKVYHKHINQKSKQ